MLRGQLQFESRACILLGEFVPNILDAQDQVLFSVVAPLRRAAKDRENFLLNRIPDDTLECVAGRATENVSVITLWRRALYFYFLRERNGSQRAGMPSVTGMAARRAITEGLANVEIR